MLRVCILTLAFLAGCDALSTDSGSFEVRLDGFRTATLAGNAFVGEASADPDGVDITLSDAESSDVVVILLPGPPAEGTYDVARGDVGVRYSQGVLTDAYRGVSGTVTLEDVSGGDVRGRLDVRAALYGDTPVLDLAGTFRSVER